MGSAISRNPIVATAVAVQKRYRLDAAEQLAAAIGFFGFLSLVPVLLLAVAAAGFVYADPADQARVALALTDALPGFESTLGDGGADTAVADLVDAVVRNRGTFGVIGLLTLLIAGLRVIGAAMAATRVVFRGNVVSGVTGWLRKLVSMVVLGVTALGAVVGSSLAAVDPGVLPRPVSLVIALAVTFAFDLVLFLTAYRVLSTTTSMRWRQLLPGALLGATGWALLKVLGASYVSGQVASANALYGTLGGVIALLLLLYLAGRLYLYGAELSAVLAERQEGPLAPPVDRDGPAHGHDGPRDAVHDGDTRRPPADAEGPPPIPRRARVAAAAAPAPPRSAAITNDATRARLEAAEARRTTQQATADRGEQARNAIALGLTAAALAAGWRLLGAGGERDRGQ